MSWLMILPIILLIVGLILNTLPYMYGTRYAGLQKLKDKTQMGFWDAFFNLFVAGLVGGIASKFHPILGVVVSLGLIYYFLKKSYNPTGKQYAIVFGAMIFSGIILVFLFQYLSVFIMKVFLGNAL